jgi:hypothetical protein
MPRTLVRAPAHDRKRSLGFLAVAWMEYFVVHGPGDVQGQPIVHGDEYTGFAVDAYALDERGRRLYDSAFLSRPKGCNKSGLGAEFALFEALGPCRFDGFAEGGEVYEDPWGLGFRYVYAAGEPMGRPVKVPFIRVMATEEDQAGNVYDTIFLNLTDDDALLSHIPGLGAFEARVLLPGGGEIVPSTTASASKDGGKETFVVFDETHLYTTSKLKLMYNTVTRNLRKRKKIAETWFLETTTMFAQGEQSVAEDTYDYAAKLEERADDGSPKYKRLRPRLLYDHRWGECEDLSREEQLRAAILEAFGEAIEWNDVDGIIDEFYDPRKDPDDSRRYFLNARRSAANAWMDAAAWGARGDASIVVADGERITLGFDGSIRDDSTALVGCRVSDGHLFLIDCWQKPRGPEGKDWQVNRPAVKATVAAAMERWDVVGFYCDPAHWQDTIDTWTQAYGKRMRVKASGPNPLEWWTNRPTAIVAALKRLHDAITTGAITHDGSSVLTTHVLNARRKTDGRAGIEIRKEYPKSPNKIDAAMAATLAYECRGDAVKAGLARPKKKRTARGF